MKSVAGRAALFQVKLSAPFAVGAASVSVPPAPRYHERALVPGSGQRANERSKPGYGAPGAPPAPLSNRIRTGGSASNALRAAAKLGWLWIGSSGSVTPSTPISAL